MKPSLAIIILLLAGCVSPNGEREKKDGYSIIEIDSCQYIEVKWCLGVDAGYYSLTHKGNCKFCAERNKHVDSLEVNHFKVDHPIIIK